MRGTVTLAAALALPTTFPHRDLILSTAFGVTLGTLVLQGLTLRPLITFLGLEDDGSVDREIRLARVETLRAAVDAITSLAVTGNAGLIRDRYAVQLQRAEEEAADDRHAPAPPAARGDEARRTTEQETEATAIRAATDAERRRLMGLRSSGTIGDAAFQRIEEELDWAELGWAHFLRTEEGDAGSGQQKTGSREKQTGNRE
jgi:monovalent cation/hydrogen antiporter